MEELGKGTMHDSEGAKKIGRRYFSLLIPWGPWKDETR